MWPLGSSVRLSHVPAALSKISGPVRQPTAATFESLGCTAIQLFQLSPWIPAFCGDGTIDQELPPSPLRHTPPTLPFGTAATAYATVRLASHDATEVRPVAGSGCVNTSWSGEVGSHVPRHAPAGPGYPCAPAITERSGPRASEVTRPQTPAACCQDGIHVVRGSSSMTAHHTPSPVARIKVVSSTKTADQIPRAGGGGMIRSPDTSMPPSTAPRPI